jgi:hypothetical protein
MKSQNITEKERTLKKTINIFNIIRETQEIKKVSKQQHIMKIYIIIDKQSRILSDICSQERQIWEVNQKMNVCELQTTQQHNKEKSISVITYRKATRSATRSKVIYKVEYSREILQNQNQEKE